MKIFFEKSKYYLLLFCLIRHIRQYNLVKIVSCFLIEEECKLENILNIIKDYL